MDEVIAKMGNDENCGRLYKQSLGSSADPASRPDGKPFETDGYGRLVY
jgi:hypothetical protein